MLLLKATRGCMWTGGTETHLLAMKWERHVRWFIREKNYFPGLPHWSAQREVLLDCEGGHEAKHLELLWRTRRVFLCGLYRELWETSFLRLVPRIMHLISVWSSVTCRHCQLLKVFQLFSHTALNRLDWLTLCPLWLWDDDTHHLQF